MPGRSSRNRYQAELADLEDRSIGGIDLVARALDRTLEAVQHQDVELAQIIIGDDDVIDGRYLEVHQRLLTMLAIQAPVASDLRLIAALIHVLMYMERMGDQCVNIAKVIPLVGHNPPSEPRIEATIADMGARVRSMVSQAKHAIANRDIGLAQDLVRQDDQVDALGRDCFRIAIETGDDLDRREWAMTMILVARALERIGDNAVDIGEQVVFIETGEFRENPDPVRPGSSAAVRSV